MSRFRNTVTGVVVEASDRVGSRLGSDWELFDGAAPLESEGAVDVEPVKRKPGRPKKS